MNAKPGDWLVVAARTDRTSGRRGKILSVGSPSGEPPYLVEWLDTGRSTLIFPGPDAIVLDAAELAEADRRAEGRFARGPQPASGAPR